MKNIHNWIIAGLLIVAVALVLVLVGGNHQPQSADFGSYPTPGTPFPHGISVGNPVTLGVNPTNVSKIMVGTCNVSFDGSSFAASTSGQFICPVSGVVAGDNVSIELPVGAGKNANGAGSIGIGFAVVATDATSSNQIGVTIANLTGAATSSFAQATTGLSYTIFGTQ